MLGITKKRRNDHKLTLFFKMYNHLAPEYLSSLIPLQVNDISRYNQRNSNNIQSIRAKTNQYNNSFLPSVLRDWNTLPAETKQSNTLSSFKYFLKKDYKPVPKYYYYGKRKTQILHTRLRTGCSSLNLDLFLKISLTHVFATVVLSKMCNITFSTADSFSIYAPYFLMIYDYMEHQL